MIPLHFGLFAGPGPNGSPAVFFGAARLELRPKAAAILAKLASAPDGFPKRQLLGVVTDSKGSLRVHVHSIRQALPRGLTVEYVPEREAYRLATV